MKVVISMRMFSGLFLASFLQQGVDFCPSEIYSTGPELTAGDLLSLDAQGFPIDVNQDGYPDLIARTSNPGGFLVMFNQRDGSFINSEFYPSSPTALSLTAADFNHDGQVDVATANYNGTVTMVRGNVVGTDAFFASPEHIALTDYELPSLITASDLNGDQLVDLILFIGFADSYRLRILFNLGDFQFGEEQDFELPTVPGLMNPRRLSCFDLEGDGDQDLIASQSACNANHLTVSVFLNRGDGILSQRHDYSAQGIDIQPGGSGLFALGDLNGDGAAEIVVSSGIGLSSIRVFKGRGDGTFFSTVAIFGSFYHSDLTVHDFNGDGTLDIASDSRFATNNRVYVLRNDTTVFQKMKFTRVGPFLSERGFTSIVSGDFDRDGNADLATMNNFTKNVTIFRNRANGICP